MRKARVETVVGACAIAVSAGGCAHASRPVVLERPADCRITPVGPSSAARCACCDPVAQRRERQGAVEAIDGDVLVLRVTEEGSITRRVAEAEIVCLARRVGRSTTARGWLAR